tara:strand:+ start:776 stop:1792 length:1017 start_codon:yes stop_codon:yes gene_type:complete
LLKDIDELKLISEQDNLWNDKEKAQEVFKKKRKLENLLNSFNNLKTEYDDLVNFYELFKSENDESLKQELSNLLKNTIKLSKELKISTLLSNEADGNNCYIEINAGAGGTESQDWAQMLLRMYLRWIEAKNLKKSIMNINNGDEAGIKSVTVKVEGENAFGLLKSESGVHRLVRISPFDAQKRRHTSFSSVWVYPIVSNNIEIEIESKDLRIDTYRASGAGGQHVNKTDSAIRISHIPTGIVVQCQNQRSQHQNKASAIKMLESRLYELELRKIEEKRNKTTKEKKEIGWGHQIRSYVMQPYRLVKDLRTGQEKSDIDKVLDGDLDDFIFSYLSSSNR